MEQVSEETTTQPIEETLAPEQTLQQQLSELSTKRTGNFPVKINHENLKFLRNKLHQKTEWKGPNEAYLMIMAILTLDNALDSLDPKSIEPTQIHLPAATIVSVNYFINRVSGTGLDSAQRLFSISMILRPAVEAIKKLDEEISVLEKEVKSERSA